jgi:hypothetical protein
LWSSEPDTVWSSLAEPVPASTLSLLSATIARRLTPQPIKLRADIELTCYTPAGIDAIRKALRAGEKQSSEAVPIKAKLVAPPLYVLSTNATDKVILFIYDVGLMTVWHDFVPLVYGCWTFRTSYWIYSRIDWGSGRVSCGQDEGNATSSHVFVNGGWLLPKTFSPRQFPRPKNKIWPNSWPKQVKKTLKSLETKMKKNRHGSRKSVSPSSSYKRYRCMIICSA